MASFGGKLFKQAGATWQIFIFLWLHSTPGAVLKGPQGTSCPYRHLRGVERWQQAEAIGMYVGREGCIFQAPVPLNTSASPKIQHPKEYSPWNLGGLHKSYFTILRNPFLDCVKNVRRRVWRPKLGFRDLSSSYHYLYMWLLASCIMPDWYSFAIASFQGSHHLSSFALPALAARSHFCLQKAQALI